MALDDRRRPSASSSNQDQEDSRILLSETLEDVLLNLQADRLRGLLPELAVSARDTFPQLNGGELADLMASQLWFEPPQEVQNLDPSQGTRWRETLSFLELVGLLTAWLGLVAAIS